MSLYHRSIFAFLIIVLPYCPSAFGQNTKTLFHLDTTGVVFTPYVKQVSGFLDYAFDKYTLQEVKTMYMLIAERFRMTCTQSTGGISEKYEYNVTYYESREKSVLSAEAASLVNVEGNTLALTVLIGVKRREGSIGQMNTEIELAFESAAIANRNFPGTATGIIFHSTDIGASIFRANTTLNQISGYKYRAYRSGLKVGTKQDCTILSRIENENTRHVAAIFTDIVRQSDFIICSIVVEQTGDPKQVDSVLNQVKMKILGFRDAISNINPYVEFMVETGWPGKGTTGWDSVANMGKYWKMINQWANEKQIKILMFEAFDLPYKQVGLDGYYGWWKIIPNQDAGRKEAYLEKILEKVETTPPNKSKSKTQLSIWVYVGASVGVIAFLLLVFLFGLLYWRVTKLQQVLSSKEVREFKYGISDETAILMEAGEKIVIEPALTIPYDKENFELEKEKIHIHRDNKLGSGQTGSVFKAVVETKKNERIQVALKMAKPGSSRKEFKSLLSEIKILSYLGRHANIVSIVGAYTREMEKGIVYVAIEICEMGSLYDYFKTERLAGRTIAKKPEQRPPDSTNVHYSNQPNIYENLSPTTVQVDEEAAYSNQRSMTTVTDMIRWAHEIACGMEYLGTKNVVHADLATRNVLLTSNKTAKITDFGLSRRLYDYTNYVKKQQEPLPWRWMAIESLKMLHFSPKSDVWSYGVTLWEIFSFGDLPYPGLSWNLRFVNDLEKGLRMVSPKYATPEIFQLMVQCWDEDPNERPTFTSLKHSTEKMARKQ